MQVKKLLGEMGIREQEDVQTASILQIKIAHAESKIKQLEAEKSSLTNNATDMETNNAILIQKIHRNGSEQNKIITVRNEVLEDKISRLTKELQQSMTQAKLFEAKFRQLEREMNGFKNRQSILTDTARTTVFQPLYSSTTTTTATSRTASLLPDANDVALDMRVRQLAAEAKVNGLLRTQQKRLRELTKRNKVIFFLSL